MYISINIKKSCLTVVQCCHWPIAQLWVMVFQWRPRHQSMSVWYYSPVPFQWTDMATWR